MDARKISDQISVSPQITPDDVAEIAKAGFRSIGSATLKKTKDGKNTQEKTTGVFQRAAK